MRIRQPFFPVFLNLQGKHCLVVGGGPVALSKAKQLVRAGARVTVVAPDILGVLKRLKNVTCRRRAFQGSDIGQGPRAPWVVFAASDNAALNQRVADICRRRRIWVNAVDRPGDCEFISPAVVRRGTLTLAISTGGRSPALAKALARQLRKGLTREHTRLAHRLSRWRPALLSVPLAQRRQLLKKLLG